MFGTLCEALLGLEGKIAPEEAVTGENLAGHRHCVADGSSCPCPAAVRPVMWCQQGQQPQPSFSVMVPPDNGCFSVLCAWPGAGGQP